MIKKIGKLLRQGKNIRIILKIFYLLGKYRFLLCFVPMEKNKSKFGMEHKETDFAVDKDELSYVWQMCKMIEWLAPKTIWESKCLVKALTIRCLLAKHHLSSTLYLGVRLNDSSQMIAHAWVRYGNYYIMGGDGKEYTVVGSYV